MSPSPALPTPLDPSGRAPRALFNYAAGAWMQGTGARTPLRHAVTGEVIAEAGSGGIDFAEMVRHARTVGGPVLRAMTFHQRARMLKALAQHLMARVEGYYAISAATGATRRDGWVDIEGGIGTLFAYASRGRRDFPDEPFHVEGPTERLSKLGTFVGRHICVPLEGVAVHINAFNFPVWGMLEKLAPTLLAGVPAIVKPATATSYLTEAVVADIVASGILPAGSVQLICGSAGDLLDHLDEQCAVAFTGSAETARMLRQRPSLVQHNVRFNAEADSLNFSMLGPDAVPGTEEFSLFIREVTNEMTSKAGQKCTAIRRTLVPASLVEEVGAALAARLAGVVIGDPAVEGVRMGPLAAAAQVGEVQRAVDAIAADAELVYGEIGLPEVTGADAARGAFYPILLFASRDPLRRTAPHDVEAFGPVNTLMPYGSLDEAIMLAKRGRGSLVGSVFTGNDTVARTVALGVAAHHGRLMLANRHTAKESTGHGSPLPHLVHGGPGRAGGGEEMGGARGVLHFMQRTALQGSPTTLTHVTHEYMPGAATTGDAVHPFRKHFEELAIGETYHTPARTITDADVDRFSELSGDHFYAHQSDAMARQGVFERKVAHGYFVLSASAGLFVDPAPGPVLANYGLEGLRFVKPVYPGDTIRARLTCKQKTAKETPADGIPQGIVAWDVEVRNQDDEPVAVYTILTLVRRQGSSL
ncbi:MAG TPA: phenylacetic acid degradation bifunctional protein PaaZ [Gemmatimonadaceae bacterium]|jgi:oxepin-CoA hydrolase/3-oxo-5,6-dehydrosuberyl-CoA semialdehyde dehydrogenase